MTEQREREAALRAASSEAPPRTGLVDKPFTRAAISRRIRELLTG